MKKNLLLITLITASYTAFAQVAVVGVSPASVVGSYDFSVQTHEFWPGQAGDGSWALTTNFTIPGTYIQADLMVADDGTPGMSALNIPLANYGCIPLTNDLTGKIALVYRYDGVTASTNCPFSTKILNAQNAGALAVIIVNRVPGVIGMLGTAPDGLADTIPGVMISDTDGASLRAAMATGTVNMFIGDKFGAFPNDAGVEAGSTLISKTSGVPSQLAQNGTEYNFEVGTRVFNYGTSDQTNLMVTANIDGPGGSSVYNNVVGPISILSGDSIDVFPGGAFSFPQFSLASYPAGRYTLSYSVALSGADDMDFDNTISSEFVVNDSIFTYSRLDPITNLPVSNNGYRPSTNTSTFSTCMVIDNPNASRIGAQGIYFAASTSASSGIALTGEEMALNLYRWEDVFVDLNDAGLLFDNLTSIAFGYYYFPNDSLTAAALQGEMVYGAFNTPVMLEDNQRFLACVQTVNTGIYLGHDTKSNYLWNEAYYLQPLTPNESDAAYFASGFGMDTPSAMGLKIFSAAELSVAESTELEGVAYPNPAVDVVTLSLNAEGAAILTVTDVTGKVALNNAITLVNSKSQVNIASLEAGVYIFNLTLENGKTSQFSVVKK